MKTFKIGFATHSKGNYNATSAAGFLDPDTGNHGFAITDGLVDNHISQCIAAVTAQEAAEITTTQHMARALDAAADEIWAHQAGNACILLARVTPDQPGWHLSWAGTCRAYEYQAGRLTQLTTDHSHPITQNSSDHATTPDGKNAPTASILHHENAGNLHTATPRSRLLLVTAGVHCFVPGKVIQNIASTNPDPHDCAHELVTAASHPSRPTSATALVIDPDSTDTYRGLPQPPPWQPLIPLVTTPPATKDRW